MIEGELLLEEIFPGHYKIMTLPDEICNIVFTMAKLDLNNLFEDRLSSRAQLWNYVQVIKI